MTIQINTCKTCGKEWERESTKGRRPVMCPECKDDPLKQKKKKLLDEEEARKRANERIDNLETALKSRGNHLSQKRPRRSYSVAELEQRIHELEEWKRDLEEQVGIVRLVKDWKDERDKFQSSSSTAQGEGAPDQVSSEADQVTKKVPGRTRRRKAA